MYVDDTNIIIIIIIIEGGDLDKIQDTTVKVLLEVQKFFSTLNLALNWDKTMCIIFNSNPEDFELKINKVKVKRVWTTSFLVYKIEILVCRDSLFLVKLSQSG